MGKTVFCVISHTHWDREWYQPFEKFRMRLCDLINNLLKILDDYPNYIFHLDAQTVVLEDYLKIYPENKKILSDYIKSGNIIVGPWYVQNDFYLSSGEATIRNAFIGTQIAEEFGKCAQVAYTADQFGLCSQLPQIILGLGFEYHLFGRGYQVYHYVENELRLKAVDINFYWQSPDGSRIKSTLMQFWYNNAQRITPKIERAVARLNQAKLDFGVFTPSDHLLMMNGVDHLEAQDDLIPILEQVNKKLSDGDKIIQTTMMDAVIANDPFRKEVVEGELRYGGEYSILAGTFSTRTEIKKLNFDTQNLIEHKVEPLYSMISLMGAKKLYPSNLIKHMWKELIPNHAHDSICCCSHPNVMKHMADRYLSINEIGEELILRGGRFINQHIERKVSGDGVYYLTVINTNQADFTGVMECGIDINITDAESDFKLFAPDGTEIEYTILEKKKDIFSAFSALNLPGEIDVMYYKIQFLAENVPGFGYKNYTLKTGYAAKELTGGKLLENEFIKVDFDRNKVNVLDKVTNKYYADVLSFEDIGDNGEAYVFSPFEGDVPIKAELKNIETLYVNPLKSAVRLVYTMDVPETKNETLRAGKIVTNKIEAVISLGDKDKAINVDITLHNNSKYHLTKAVINTSIDNTITYASSVFDIIKRDSKDILRPVRTCGSQPVNGFVYKMQDECGMCVFTKGLYEYENDENEKIKLSLLRSTDKITGKSWESERGWGVSDNLMLGTYNLSFAIMPFNGDDTKLASAQQHINSQPLYMFDSTDTHMFTGGRHAVQSGDVDDLYFEKDKYEHIKLPHAAQFIKVSDNVCVSALKKAEKTDDVVIRMYNPKDTEIEDYIEVKDYSLVKTNIAETECDKFTNKLGNKKIETLFIR